MATLFWISGAETGSIAEFPDGPQTPGAGGGSIVTSPSRTGTYALQCPVFKEAEVRVAGWAATTYFRGYLYVTANPTGAPVSVLGVGSNSTIPKFHLYINTDGTLGWGFSTGCTTPTNSGADALTLSAWNLIEIKFVRDPSVGGMEVYLNGALQFSNFTVATTSGTSSTSNYLFLGDLDQGDCGGTAPTTTWDDMALATGGYIGAGGSVAIQGKSGTPTYDAWTKSSGSDASALWSNTPFDNTSYCTSIVIGDRQTMLVDDSALEAAIGAADTINGACVVVMCKSASGSPTFKIVRRVAGVDTVSATRFLQTTDGWRPRGVDSENYDVFVDTRANLASAEIGVECNSSTILETIEDVWLLVDSTPAAALTLELPIPLESLGAPPAVLTLLPNIPLESAGKDGAPLDVVFSIYDRITTPLNVQFDVQEVPLVLNPLTVRFDVVQANPDALLVMFDIIPQDVVSGVTNDVQAPIARVTL
jgi:hypothetical protein